MASGSGLRDAIALQQQALAGLRQSREASGAWCDEPRRSLDRQVLDPLQEDGQRLLERLRGAARDIAQAQQGLVR